MIFFQAEDGIRDVAVTGVQTCALPIFVAVSHDVQNVGQPQAIPTVETQSPRRCRYPREGHSRTILWPSDRPTVLRSEDRRVGKEGRSRWSTYHLKKRRMRRTNSKEDFK